MDFPRLSRLLALPEQYPDYDPTNTVLIAVQHLLGTNGSLFELLNSMGLPYGQMFLLGKVYSTNEAVYSELKDRGAYVHPASVSLDNAQLVVDYTLNLAMAADELLAKATATLERLPAPRTLLIVDDGGVLISLASDRVSEINARIVGIEQTRSGANTLRTIPDLRFSVVNVAESRAKLRHESPYIAASIIEHIQNRLARIPNHKTLGESSILVVGHGAIGGNVAAQLRSLAKSVEVHDVIGLQGVAVIQDFKEVVQGKDIVIGCVGKAWLPENCQVLLPSHIILASSSSSNSEFLGLSIDVKPSIGQPLSLRHKGLMRAHSDYSFNGGEGWVLNAGFPVNFDGSPDPITPETIELTRMLMLSGILQALTTEAEPGLCELIVKFQPIPPLPSSQQVAVLRYLL